MIVDRVAKVYFGPTSRVLGRALWKGAAQLKSLKLMLIALLLLMILLVSAIEHDPPAYLIDLQARILPQSYATLLNNKQGKGL